jgi:hypothetical protein
VSMGDAPGPGPDLPAPLNSDGASTPPSDAAGDYPGPGAEFVHDPGEPPRLFGPICSGSAARGPATPGALDGTLYATSRPGSAHVYVRFGSLPANVQSAYLSLVFPGGPWTVGTRQGASAGRVEVTFRDGVRFASSGASELELRVTEASPSPNPGDPTHYLRGELIAKLRPAVGDEVVQLNIRCQ